MGGKGGTKINQPDPVDPYDSANAQLGMNFMTSLSNLYGNRIGQSTPYGSLSYETNGYTKIDPKTGQVTQVKTPESQNTMSATEFNKYKNLKTTKNLNQQQKEMYNLVKSFDDYKTYQNDFFANSAKYLPNQTQKVNLSPQQQKILDLQQKQDFQSANINNIQMDRVGQTLGAKFDPRLQAFNDGADTVGNFKNVDFSKSPKMISDANQKTNVDLRNNPQMISDANQKTNVDLRNNPQMISDINQTGYDFKNNPNLPGINDFSAERQRTEDATYKRFDKQFARDEESLRTKLANQGITVGSDAWNAEFEALNQAKNDARTQAILAGSGEQSRMFGLGMQARQQANSEDMNIRDSFNAASMNNANFRNNARQQANQEDFDMARFSNDANLNSANFRNNARQQANQEDFDMARFSNDANLNSANFRNNTRQQANNEVLQSVNVNNENERQKFSQQQEMASFDNQLRNQQFQEAMQRRQMPINEYASLRSGQQIQQPSFNPFYQIGLQGGDIQGGLQNQFDQQMSKYNAGVAQKNNAKAGTNDLMKTGAMAFASSDPLLKTDIEKVANIRGHNIYKYKMIKTGKTEIGVMADEIAMLRPDCVACDDEGFLMVDYQKLFPEHYDAEKQLIN